MKNLISRNSLPPNENLEFVAPFAGYLSRNNLNSSLDPVVKELILLKQLATGDRTVFWQLWLLHQDYLYRCCFKWMNHNPTNTEDALHLAMLKAYQKLPQYADKITHLKAWLRKLCYLMCLDLHRKHKKEIFGDENLLDSISISSDLDTAIASETQDTLKQAVNDLPPQLQQPFILRFYEDRSYAEIAQTLSISNCNARKRVQLARTKVKRQLTTYLSKEM